MAAEQPTPTIPLSSASETPEAFTRDDALDSITPTVLILLAIIILFLVGRRQRELNRRKDQHIARLTRRNRG